jgi:hypothetical protein
VTKHLAIALSLQTIKLFTLIYCTETNTLFVILSQWLYLQLLGRYALKRSEKELNGVLREIG